MRYTLRNSSPSDPGILSHNGGFILAGSRADAERLVYDNQKVWKVFTDLLWSPGLNADDIRETDEAMNAAREVFDQAGSPPSLEIFR